MKLKYEQDTAGFLLLFAKFIFCIATIFYVIGFLTRVGNAHEHNGIVIVFKDNVTTSEIDTFYPEYYESFGVKMVKSWRGNSALLDADQGLITTLQRDPRIKYAEPNFIYTTNIIPNDTHFATQYGLHNVGQTGGLTDADIDAPEAWDFTVNTDDVLVAVIDTGIDTGHEDLAANIWVNPGEIAANGIDDDGNGYIDDVHGINAITGTGGPFDDNGHGTHTSGTIAAVFNNATGVAGVSRHAKIISCKFLNELGSGNLANAAECFHYVNHLKNVLGQDIRLSNNSWSGGGFSQILRDAMEGLDQPGMDPILHMAAAGNNNFDNDIALTFPASYTLANIIAVAATDSFDNYATFSNFGLTTVDLAAPGVNIISTVPTGICQLCDPGGYRVLNGTSFAAPHVAGVASMLFEQDPLNTEASVKQTLMDTVDPLLTIINHTVTDGRLNAFAALESANPPTLVLVSLAVTPTSTQLNIDDGQNFMATGTFDDGSTSNLTSTSIWTSNNPVIASIDNTGLCFGESPGITTIFATHSGVTSNSSTVEVFDPNPPALVSLSITPLTATLDFNETQQFSSTGTFSDGSSSDLTPESAWFTTNQFVARIDNTGLSTGVTPGMVFIFATHSGVTSNNAIVTVVAPAPPPPAEVIEIDKAEFRTDDNEYRVDGESDIPGPGNFISVYGGSTVAGGLLLGTTEVEPAEEGEAVGEWEFREETLPFFPFISIQSTGGAKVEGIVVEIVNP